MDAARAVLARLDRIEELNVHGAPARELLDELRALLVEAEAWAALEGDDRAHRAVEGLRASVGSPEDGERRVFTSG